MIELIGSFFILLGAIFDFNAAIGMIRLPNTLARMHANAKPQTLGILLILIGGMLIFKNFNVIGVLILCFIFLLLSASVVSHLIGKTFYDFDTKKSNNVS